MKSFFILILLALSASSFAGVLPAKKQMMRVSVSQSTAKKLWKESSDETYYAMGEGETLFHQYNLNYSRGIGFQLQFDVEIGLGTSEIEGGGEGDAVDGDDLSGLNNISFKLTRHLYHNSWYSLDFYLKYRHPGETTPEQPAFIALNDFSQHYITGLAESFSLSKKMTITSDFRFIHRRGLPKDQIALDLALSYGFTQKFNAVIGLNWLHTFSGPDISTPAFAALISSEGMPPFYAARERFLGHSVFLSYSTGKSQWIDVFAFRKFWGRNTDVSTTIGLGFNQLF